MKNHAGARYKAQADTFELLESDISFLDKDVIHGLVPLWWYLTRRNPHRKVFDSLSTFAEKSVQRIPWKQLYVESIVIIRHLNPAFNLQNFSPYLGCLSNKTLGKWTV